MQALALVDEGYLANELNHGARMLALPRSWEEAPDLDTLPPADGDFERYSMAIAEILHVAEWRGFDIDEILEDATQHVDAIVSYCADAAAKRPTS